MKTLIGVKDLWTGKINKARVTGLWYINEENNLMIIEVRYGLFHTDFVSETQILIFNKCKWY